MTLDNNLAVAVPRLSSLFQAFPSQYLTYRLGIFTILVVILLAQYVRSSWRKVPPGPKGLPILGNALQLQNTKSGCTRKSASKISVRLNYMFFLDSVTLLIYPSNSQNILCI
jgi:hypothetical protein